MLAFIAKSGKAFDPQTRRLIMAAFDDAWASLIASGAPFAKDDYASVGREILAVHIIEAAARGERDPRRLSEDALLYLSQSKLRRSPPVVPA
jgi:hypothetical protein